jgi:6-phosphogluconolactonase (cycloisomerase 2 family)
MSVIGCQKDQKRTLLFVGSYTDKKPSKGISIYEFNNETGEAELKLDSLINSSFLLLSPNGKFLYSVIESQMPYHGKVAAFSIDSLHGKISLLNSQDCGGKNPVHLEIDKTGQYLINSNYTDPSLSVFKIKTDGSLNKNSQTIPFQGSSIIKERQTTAHIHSSNFSPNGKYLFVQDLGTDKIHNFSIIKNKNEALRLQKNAPLKVEPGSGPRHFTFHPNGKYGYGIAELSGKITAYRLTENGLEFLEDYQANSKTQDIYRSADIHISPDGKFLYVSNRGSDENTIAIFSINIKDGMLKLVGHESTYGEHPRNFAIDPSGNFLLVANQFSDNIVIFRRNPKTGKLRKLPNELSIGTPASLQMRTYDLMQ